MRIEWMVWMPEAFAVGWFGTGAVVNLWIKRGKNNGMQV